MNKQRMEGDHCQVSENVFNNLSEWQQDLWLGTRDEFIGQYSLYPDLLAPHISHEEKIKVEPRYNELMSLDGKNLECCVLNELSSQESKSQELPFVRNYGETWHRVIPPVPFAKVFGFYFDILERSIKDGDHDWAAKVAGIVSHILCDRQPGDHIDPGVWLGLILPPPEEIKPQLSDCWGITTQEVDIPHVKYKPCLLGLSKDEAMVNFYQRYLGNTKKSIGTISRMILEVYNGKPDEAQRILSENRLLVVEMITDFIYTAFCIAYDRFELEEIEKLKTSDLSKRFPVINDMDYLYFYGPYTDGVIDFFADGPLRPRKIPAELLVKNDDGSLVSKVISPVLSVLPDSGCQHPERWARLVYELPDNCFSRFTCIAGLPPSLSVNTKNGLRGKVKAKIIGDEKILFERNPINGGDPAIEIDISIYGVKRLELLVEGLHDCSDEFWLGHFIWGKPLLIKN